MISGQARRRRVGREQSTPYYGALIALCISTAALAHAQTSHRLVLVHPENSELITRVEGQTRDLGVSLDVATSGWTSGNAEDAARIATQRGADFVARVRRSARGGLEVRVYAASSRSLRARNVSSHTRSDRLTTSAELEAAALVLRGELNALIEAEREAAANTPASTAPPVAAAGGAPATTSGTGRSQQLPAERTSTPATREKPATAAPVAVREPQEPEADDEPDADEDEEVDEADPEEPEEPPSPPLESYTDARSPWTIRGGVRASVPIASKLPFGLVLGGRAPILPFLELGLAIGTALPFELRNPTVRIELWRSFASAEAFAVFPVGPRLRALVGVDAGVVLYGRRTTRVLAGYAPEGSEPAWSATLGAQAELQWLLTRNFGVSLGVGLAYLPTRTKFAYTEDPNPKPRDFAELRSLEPHATASLFGLLGD